MITSNPFAELSASIPPVVMQTFVVAMIVLVAAGTLFPTAKSWYMGANIPGKPSVFLPFVGGFGNYRVICEEIISAGYTGFAFRPTRQSVASN